MSRHNWVHEQQIPHISGFQDPRLEAGIGHPVWDKIKDLGASATKWDMELYQGVEAEELSVRPTSTSPDSGPFTSYL